jgi:hypothetical protein
MHGLGILERAPDTNRNYGTVFKQVISVRTAHGTEEFTILFGKGEDGYFPIAAPVDSMTAFPQIMSRTVARRTRAGIGAKDLGEGERPTFREGNLFTALLTGI